MSDVRIDSISLEVDSSAALSADGIDKLAEALAKLKGSAKLTSTANNLAKLSTSLRALQNTDSATQQIRSIATALNQLSNVKDTSNFRKAVSQVRSLAKAMNGFNASAVTGQIRTLATALEPLSGIGKSTLGSTLNQLKKIPEITAKLDATTLSDFSYRMLHLAKIMGPLASEMAKVSSGFSALPKNITRAVSSIDKYNSSAGRTVKKNNILNKSLMSVKTGWLVYGYAVRKVADLLTDAFVDFTERYETMNLFSVAMGEYTEEAYDYALKVQEALGINAAEWAKDQAVFMQLIAGFGEARDQAYEMSKGLTQITYDISSLFNLPLEEAFTKVQSGISGELEPLRRLGFDLSVARLQEIALAQGIQKKVSAMNQAEKSELRYIAITQQMPNVIGDMARTIYSPANALRVLRSQFSLLSQTIGSLVNVVVYKMIPVIQAMVSVIIAAANAISVLLTGKSLKNWDMESFGMASNLGSAAGAADDIADSTGAAADNLGSAADSAKKARDYLMGWDELNVIDTTSAAGGGGGGGGGAGGGGGGGLGLDLDSLWTDSMLDNLLGQTDELREKMKDLLEYAAVIGGLFLGWKLAKGFMEKMGLLKDIIGKLGPDVETGRLGFIRMFAAVLAIAGAVKSLKESLDKVISGVTLENTIGQFAGWAVAIAGVAIALDDLTKGGIAGLILSLADIVATFIAMKTELEELGTISDSTWLGWLVDWAEIAIAAGLTFGPEGAIVAAIGYLLATLLAFALPEKFQEMKDEFIRIWEALKIGVSDAVDVILAYIDLFKVGVQQVITFIKTGTIDTSDAIKQRVTADLEVINSKHSSMSGDVIRENDKLYHSWMEWQKDVNAKSDIYYENQIKQYDYMKEHWDQMTRGQLGSFEDFCKNTENRNTVLGSQLGKVYDSLEKDWSDTNTNMTSKFSITVADLGNKTLDIQTAMEDASTGSAVAWETAYGNISTYSSTTAGDIETDMKNIPDKVNSYSSDFENTGKHMLDGVMNGFGSFSVVNQKIIEWKNKFIDKLKSAFSIASPSRVMRDEVGIYLGQGVGEGLVKSMSAVAGNITTFADSVLTSFSNQFEMNGADDSKNAFLDYGLTMMEALSNGLQDNSASVYSTLKLIADTINSIMADLVYDTQRQARAIIDAARAAREAANSVGASGSVSKIGTALSITKRAAGGAVPSGQLFIANEAGPELVGSIGNTTAVMNNEQIVSAVATGVANAVASVMGSRADGNQRVEVYLDGEKIYANQKKIARNKGVAFDLGAFSR